jgi:hypothetical protein
MNDWFAICLDSERLFKELPRARLGDGVASLPRTMLSTTLPQFPVPPTLS